jgi:Xaa-Pro aminopeptidase
MLTIITAAAIAVSSGHQAAPAPQTAASMVVVDGSQTPEAIPEWLAWESGFQTLLLVGDRPGSSFTTDLREVLSEDEMVALQRAAEQQRRAHTRAAEATEKLRQRLAADPEDGQAVAQQLHDVNLRYRRAVLAAREQALGRLGAQAQAAILAWIGEVRTTIRFTVPKSELEQFRMPQ